MRTFLIAAAFSVACLAPCCADDTSDGRQDDRLANSREGGAASAFSPAQLKELEQILQSVLSRALANDGHSRNANTKFRFIVHDDEEKPREPGDGHRRDDGRDAGERRESGQREHGGPHGEARDEGRHEADHGPHPGPGQGPAGGPAHVTPGEHPPHTITLHIYVHHDSGGGPPPATQHGNHGRPHEMHRSVGPPPARHWTHHGRPGEMHHSPRGHRDHRLRESDDHGEGDKEKSTDNMQSLRDDVDCLSKELEDLSRHVRKLAHEGR